MQWQSAECRPRDCCLSLSVSWSGTEGCSAVSAVSRSGDDDYPYVCACVDQELKPSLETSSPGRWCLVLGLPLLTAVTRGSVLDHVLHVQAWCNV